MRLPDEWGHEAPSGWFASVRLIHKPCGWKSNLPYDLIMDEPQVRNVIAGHRCLEADSEFRKDDRVKDGESDELRYGLVVEINRPDQEALVCWGDGTPSAWRSFTSLEPAPPYDGPRTW